MVGGVVIGLSEKDGETHVHVAECPHYPKHGRGDECPRPNTCCVYTDARKIETGETVSINIGDSLWWQCGRCYWTPKENRSRAGNRRGIDYDIQLTKIGYSH